MPYNSSKQVILFIVTVEQVDDGQYMLSFTKGADSQEGAIHSTGKQDSNGTKRYLIRTVYSLVEVIVFHWFPIEQVGAAFDNFVTFFGTGIYINFGYPRAILVESRRLVLSVHFYLYIHHLSFTLLVQILPHLTQRDT